MVSLLLRLSRRLGFSYSSTGVRKLPSIWSLGQKVENFARPSRFNRVESPVIGIDLGTTNSQVALLEGKHAKVIGNSDGARTMPSVVAFCKDGKILVGTPAKHKFMSTTHIKRLLGKKFDDIKRQNLMKMDPYSCKVVKAPNGDAWIEARGQQYSSSQLGAFILSKMKETAESYIGKSVSKAVIAVPANFNDAQRLAIKNAGRIAGLDVQRIIDEPIAAALSCGLNNKDRVIAVFDLGGGSLNVSILEVSNGIIKVKATNDDTFLGGEDFDNALVEYLVGEIKRTDGIDLSEDDGSLQKLREVAEKAKRELSYFSETEIKLSVFTPDRMDIRFSSKILDSGPESFFVEMPQSIKEFFVWLLSCCLEAPLPTEAWSNFKKVIQTHSRARDVYITLTRSKFESLVSDLIERIKNPCNSSLKDAGISAKDVEEVLLVGGMTRVPKVQAVVTEIFGKSPYDGVNPDEAVAVGAAIQGGMLCGDSKELLHMGLASSVSTSFPGNASDLSFRRAFHTVRGSLKSAANTFVGTFFIDKSNMITNTPSKKSQVVCASVLSGKRVWPALSLTYYLDRDGDVTLSVKDKVMEKERQIDLSSGISKDEVTKFIKEAELCAEKDHAPFKTMIHTVEKTFAELGDEMDPDCATEGRKIIADLRYFLDANNRDDTEAHT